MATTLSAYHQSPAISQIESLYGGQLQRMPIQIQAVLLRVLTDRLCQVCLGRHPTALAEQFRDWYGYFFGYTELAKVLECLDEELAALPNPESEVLLALIAGLANFPGGGL